MNGIVVVGHKGKVRIVNLNPEDPDPPNIEKWVMIEGDGNGSYYGTGFGFRDGKQKIYISGPESDVSLDAAINAARSWAEKSSVETIYVRNCAEH